MSIPKKTTFKDVTLSEGTTSIATTPIAAVFVAPCAGTVVKVLAGALGATTGTIAVAVGVNGGADVSGGLLTIAAGTNGSKSVDLAKTGASAVVVAEGDLISFTPSGGTGASIPGAFAAVIRPQ
jgi:hypothetical protein